MAVVPQNIKDLPSGEFAALSDGTIQPLIDEAVREVNAGVFGARVDDGVKYLAAHLLAVMKRGSSAPATNIVQETAGPLTRMYAQGGGGAESSNPLMSTAYGRRYLEIRQQVAGGPWVL